MVHNLSLYQKALNLRQQGNSYREIKEALGIPKSTISYWFKDLKLPKSIRKVIIDKEIKGRKQLMEFNRKRTQFIRLENARVRQAAFKEVKKISKYELMLIGASLYWAEGYNRQESVRSPYLSFGNSNAGMVTLFLRFLKDVMNIPNNDLRPAIQIHENIRAKSAVRFWAKNTGIPEKRFRVICQVSRASKGKRPYNSLPHGTFRVDVRGRQNFFKVKGWIDGLMINNRNN
jgi:hypothetical protein